VAPFSAHNRSLGRIGMGEKLSLRALSISLTALARRGLCTRHVKTRFCALYSIESKTSTDTARFLTKVEREFARF
jgi:hypothetical protein